MILKGKLVQIHKIILKKEERASQVPEDTKNTPLEMWVKGYLCEDSKVGERCNVITVTGRKVEGTLVDGGLKYEYDFGNYVEELDEIKHRVFKILYTDEVK